MDQPTYFIAFTNNAGKQHSHARCGASRTNRIHNTPKLVEGYPTNPCGRCGSGFTMADASTIFDAWLDAFRVARHSPYGGLPKDYVEEQVRLMRVDWREKALGQQAT